MTNKSHAYFSIKKKEEDCFIFQSRLLYFRLPKQTRNSMTIYFFPFHARNFFIISTMTPLCSERNISLRFIFHTLGKVMGISPPLKGQMEIYTTRATQPFQLHQL